MKARWEEWQSIVNEWALSRRLIMLGGILVISYVIWQNFFMDTLESQARELNLKIESVDAEIKKVNQTTTLFSLQQKEDPNIDLRKRIKKIRSELFDIDSQLKVLTDRLISPREMANVIETMLLENTNMQLVQLKGSGAESLLDGTLSNEETSSKGLYRHGIRVVFNGSYLDTLSYLKALETLPIEFLWDRLQIHVESYPQTQIILDIYTLSLSKDWVGV